MGAYEGLLIALKMLDLTPWDNYPLSYLYIHKDVCAFSGHSKGAAHWPDLGSTSCLCQSRLWAGAAWPDARLGVLFFSLRDISLINILSLFLSALKSVPIVNEVEAQRTVYRFGDLHVCVPALLNQMYKKSFHDISLGVDRKEWSFIFWLKQTFCTKWKMMVRKDQLLTQSQSESTFSSLAWILENKKVREGGRVHPPALQFQRKAQCSPGHWILLWAAKSAGNHRPLCISQLVLLREALSGFFLF